MTLAERETELRVLTEMLAAGQAGDGGVALIRGATATGKTALLDACARAAEAAGSRYLGTTASRTERSVPLGVVTELLRSITLPASSAETVAQLLGDDLLSTALYESGPGGHLDKQILQKIGKVLLDLADERPLVIGVDDLHYADEPSLLCLAYLARRLRPARISLVFTESASPHTVHPLVHTEIMTLPYCRGIRLDLLSPPGVERLLRTRFESPAAQRLAAECHRLSGGNPLLVQGLMDDHRSAGPSGPAHLVPGDAYGQAVLSCLYRSGSPVVDTARALAVMGGPTEPAVLGEMLEFKPEAIDQANSALTRAGLLAGDWFRHPALPDTILRHMIPNQRAALHADAARALHLHGAPEQELAGHLVAADGVQASWVVPTLRQAGEQALADGEIERAIRFLRAGLEASTDPQGKLVLRYLLCGAEWLVDPASVQRHLPGLIDAVAAGTLDPGSAISLTACLLWHGRPEDAAALVGAAERQGGDSAELQCVRQWLGHVYPGMSRARTAGPAAEPDDVPAGTVAETHHGVSSLITVLRRKADSRTLAKAEQLLQVPRLDVTTVAPTWTALAALVYADELDRANAWCEALVAEAEQRGAPLYKALFLALRSVVAFRTGRLGEAEEHARTALTTISLKSWGVVVGLPLAGMLLATTALGKREEATAYYGMPVPPAMFQTPFGLHYLQARGHYHLASGRAHAALGDFQRCGDLMARWELDVPTFIPWRTDAAQALLTIGDTARARELAEQQLELPGVDSRRTHGMSLRILAAATELRRRLPLLRKAVEILETSADQYELALTISDLSRAHWALGEPDKAQVIESRTKHLTERYEHRPPPAGLFPDLAGERQAATRADGIGTITRLSNAELRVAMLAAQGYSNRQISNELFVTVSTVEQHLTRVYRKLSVGSRAELSAELRYANAR